MRNEELQSIDAAFRRNDQEWTSRGTELDTFCSAVSSLHFFVVQSCLPLLGCLFACNEAIFCFGVGQQPKTISESYKLSAMGAQSFPAFARTARASSTPWRRRDFRVLGFELRTLLGLGFKREVSRGGPSCPGKKAGAICRSRPWVQGQLRGPQVVRFWL